MPVDPSATALTASVTGVLALAAQARVQALALTGIDSDKVVIRAVSWDANLKPPYVIIRPAPEIINPDWGSTDGNDLEFAFIISLILANPETGLTEIGLPLLWRDSIRWDMQNKGNATWQFGGVGGTFPRTGNNFLRSKIVDGEPFIEEAQKRGYNAQYLALRMYARESRSGS